MNACYRLVLWPCLSQVIAKSVLSAVFHLHFQSWPIKHLTECNLLAEIFLDD